MSIEYDPALEDFSPPAWADRSVSPLFAESVAHSGF